MPSRLYKSVLLTAVLLGLTGAAHASEQVLTPHSAEYKVKISVLSGKLRTQLRATETGYEATHRIDPTGLARLFTGGIIDETSRFETVHDGVLPQKYVSTDTISRDKTRA
ncbi:MAG: hypothetical protein ACE5F8_02540, partial [Woeseiaceae bacterium]